MPAGLLASTLAMVVVACGSSETTSDGSPTIEITSIELDGPTASIRFEVRAEGDLPTTQVNWGDDTSSPEVRSGGILSETHTYGDGIVEATIVVTLVDEEGSVASAARSISLAATASTTDSVPPDESTTTSTTTDGSTTTAPTAVPPTPHTTVPRATSSTATSRSFGRSRAAPTAPTASFSRSASPRAMRSTIHTACRWRPRGSP
jgi:hypothetical protein